MRKIVALAGGVGGAKLAYGLSKLIAPEDFSVIVNTGDDFELFGLKLCPDLDTVCYTLADIANSESGWGREHETWNCFNALRDLDAPTWFKLGDNDLALHLERTRLSVEGVSLTEITNSISRKLGIRCNVLPMTDDPVVTIISTKEYGDLSFQEYFVKYQYSPTMKGFRFDGADWAKTSEKVIKVLDEADLIVICPSNPWVSIMPILSIKPIYERVLKKNTIAVSPIIGGTAVKGPAAKMYSEMGIQPSAMEVARQYKSFIRGFVIDNVDREQSNLIKQWGIIPLVTDTLMVSIEDRKRLAQEVLDFSLKLI